MEKTFSDLLKPHQKRLDWNNQNRIWIDKADVIQLLQQVREATIAECSTKVFHFLGNSPESFEICAIIDELPTDRIKINL